MYNISCKYINHDKIYKSILYSCQQTRIVLNNAIVGRRPEFFRSPDKFIPERWMRGQGDKIHPFGAIQFSHGPRMCPGMRMAEQEMILGTIRVKVSISYFVIENFYILLAVSNKNILQNMKKLTSQ